MANKSIDECKDLKTLFELWKNKSPKNINGFEINHKDNVFISDGIVNPQIWFDQKPRILFVLKEAYSNKNDGDWLLTDWIASGECLHYKIWRRIAIWTYGVLHTTRHSICPYKEQYPEAVYKDILQRIAILNIKKSNGKSKLDYDELEAYALGKAANTMLDADKHNVKSENPNVERYANARQEAMNHRHLSSTRKNRREKVRFKNGGNGYIETESNGVQYLVDYGNRRRGSYDPIRNETYDEKGRKVGKGNVLRSLL